MTYVYRARDGSEVERDYQGKAPERIKVRGLFYSKFRILMPNTIIPEHHRAVTYAGRDGDKRTKRQAQNNTWLANQIKSGKEYEPKMSSEVPREWKTDFERKLKD